MGGDGGARRPTGRLGEMEWRLGKVGGDWEAMEHDFALLIRGVESLGSQAIVRGTESLGSQALE